jgi:hypothetical protein
VVIPTESRAKNETVVISTKIWWIKGGKKTASGKKTFFS